MEVWKDVKGFDGLYQVSNYGQVKRLAKKVYQKSGVYATYKTKILKQETVKGYKRVSLSKENLVTRITVHRLVALTFIENNENKPQVNHIDGDKTNNHVCNLEWCTANENEKHSYLFLGKITNGIKSRKINIKDLPLIKQMYLDGFIQKEIAFKFNVSETTIQNILNGNRYVKHL